MSQRNDLQSNDIYASDLHLSVFVCDYTDQ